MSPTYVCDLVLLDSLNFMDQIMLSQWNRDRLGPTYLEPGPQVAKYTSAEKSQVLQNKIVWELTKNGYLNKFEVLDHGDGVKIVSPILKITNSREIGNGTIPISTEQIPQDLRLLCAKKWIHLNLELLKNRLCMIDAKLENFAFHKGADACWIDLGSIVPIRNGLEGISGFNSAFLFPLLLLGKNLSASDEESVRSSKSISRKQFGGKVNYPVFSYRNSSLTVSLLSLIAKFPVRLPVRVVRYLALRHVGLRLSFQERRLKLKRLVGKSLYSKPRGLISRIKEMNWDTLVVLDSGSGNWLSDLERKGTVMVFLDPDETKVRQFNSYIRDGGSFFESDVVGIYGDLDNTQLNPDLMVIRVGVSDFLDRWTSPETFVSHLLRADAKNFAIELRADQHSPGVQESMPWIKHRLVPMVKNHYELTNLTQGTNRISFVIRRSPHDASQRSERWQTSKNGFN